MRFSGDTVGWRNGLIFLLDAATSSACLLPVGVGAHLSGAFCALITASITTTLTPVPVEAALTETLSLRCLAWRLSLLPEFMLLRPAHMEEPHGEG